ncbi:MAG: hypothetical protein IPQ00_00025 [Chloracidobacterium sp.]|nr:hypothetical protein [Chloracidobacterium sp.]
MAPAPVPVPYETVPRMKQEVSKPQRYRSRILASSIPPKFIGFRCGLAHITVRQLPVRVPKLKLGVYGLS